MHLNDRQKTLRKASDEESYLMETCSARAEEIENIEGRTGMYYVTGKKHLEDKLKKLIRQS